jgi:hypothetical protein
MDEPLTFSNVCGTQRCFFGNYDEERLGLIVKSLGKTAITGRTGKVIFTLQEMTLAEALELRERGWTVESVNEGAYFTELGLPGRARAQTGWSVSLPI